MNIDYVRLIRVRPNVLSSPSGNGRLAGKRMRPIPDGFWVEGHLTKPIEVGQTIEVRCTCYQGKICVCGYIYRSTEVIKIFRDYVFTRDAQYKVLRVPLFDPIGSLLAWQ